MSEACPHCGQPHKGNGNVVADLVACRSEVERQRDGLVDGIKHANTMLLDLWERMGEEGPRADAVRAITAHLSGTIMRPDGMGPYMTRLESLEAARDRLRDGGTGP